MQSRQAAFGNKPDHSIFRRKAAVCRHTAKMSRGFSKISYKKDKDLQN